MIDDLVNSVLNWWSILLDIFTRLLLFGGSKLKLPFGIVYMVNIPIRLFFPLVFPRFSTRFSPNVPFLWLLVLFLLFWLPDPNVSKTLTRNPNRYCYVTLDSVDCISPKINHLSLLCYRPVKMREFNINKDSMHLSRVSRCQKLLRQVRYLLFIYSFSDPYFKRSPSLKSQFLHLILAVLLSSILIDRAWDSSIKTVIPTFVLL